MTPPRLRIFSDTPLELTCESCEATPEAPVMSGGADVFLRAETYTPRLDEGPWQVPSIFRRPALASESLSLRSVPPAAQREAQSPQPPLSFSDFLPALVEFANHIERMDLDLFNIPINRGSGLCRFSEYTPRALRPAGCNLVVEAGTTARGHGEIRPVQGSSESLITRVMVDFQPNVVNLLGPIPPLEIDGFSAVDPPLMSFDPTFPSREHSVLAMSGGQYDYENPLATGGSWVSDFESTAPTPPGGHRYWMFRFAPLANTLVAGLEEAFSNGAFSPVLNNGLGALLLWAFLPTTGLSAPEPYEALGIPFNTFPRRFGDLIQLLSPLFVRALREPLREAAPLINPNSEYIDSEGHRRPIPDDPLQIESLNRERVAQGLPPLGRNRGPILDWIGSDLMANAARLAATAVEALPRVSARIRLGDMNLATPFGSLQIHAGTELSVDYAFVRVQDRGSGEWRTQRGLRVRVEPLEVGDVRLDLRGFGIETGELHAQRAVFFIPALDEITSSTRSDQVQWSMTLEGLEMERLAIHDPEAGLNLTTGEARLGSLRFDRYPNSLRADLEDFAAQDLRVAHELGGLSVAHAVIPNLSLRSTLGDRGQLSLQMDRLQSEGELELNWQGTHLDLSASTEIDDLSFSREARDGSRVSLLNFDFSGAVEAASLTHEALGRAQFNTADPSSQCADASSCRFTGHFRSRSERPLEAGQASPPADYHLEMDLPFMGLWTEDSFIEVPRGSSSLTHAHLEVSPGSVRLAGDLDLHAALPRGLGRGPTEIGNFTLNPRIEDLHVLGPAEFEFFRGGWRLQRPEGETRSLDLSASIVDSEIVHRPSSLPEVLTRHPESAIIRTDVVLRHATVTMEDLRRMEYRQIGTESEPRGGFTAFESGPITAHHLEGSGSLWANLVLWGFVRGFFPHLGGSRGAARPAVPDAGPLLAHLPESVRATLGDGDFLRIGGLSFGRFSNGWETDLQDLLLNIHEAGGRGQFGMIRVPRIFLGARPGDGSRTSPEGGSPARDRDLEWFVDGNYLLNIFLNDPQRGGSFRFYRWPAPPPPSGTIAQ